MTEWLKVPIFSLWCDTTQLSIKLYHVVRTQLKPQLHWPLCQQSGVSPKGRYGEQFPNPCGTDEDKKERKGYLTVIFHETRSQMFINVNNSFTQHLWSTYWYFDSVVKFLLLVSSLCVCVCVHVCAHMCVTVCRYMYLCGINANK